MKILFVSLGCDKNLVDSEEMLGALRQAGYSFTDDEEEADIAVVNTCCFIMDAQKESIDQILALAGRRTEGQLKALIVTGCLAQRYKYDILKEIPEVDAVIGTTAEKKIVETLHEILANDGEAGSNGYLLMENENRRTGTAAERVVTTGGYYSYLKIAEGCDKRCTYCVIPYIRGHYRSMPMEELIAQAEALAAKGVRELILVAQETTLYGDVLLPGGDHERDRRGDPGPSQSRTLHRYAGTARVGRYFEANGQADKPGGAPAEGVDAP